MSYYVVDLQSFFTTTLTISIVLGIISLVLCPIIASVKGRNSVGWFFGGLFFGLLALIIIICLGEKEEESEEEYDEYEEEYDEEEEEDEEAEEKPLDEDPKEDVGDHGEEHKN